LENTIASSLKSSGTYLIVAAVAELFAAVVVTVLVIDQSRKMRD
jgi:hypothetical protein